MKNENENEIDTDAAADGAAASAAASRETTVKTVVKPRAAAEAAAAAPAAAASVSMSFYFHCNFIFKTTVNFEVVVLRVSFPHFLQNPVPEATGHRNHPLDVIEFLNSVLAKGGSGDKGVLHTNFGINYHSISFGQLSGYIVFCILLIGGASPHV